MALTASELRRNIYRLLDQVLETGIPLEIQRGDQTLKISAVEGPSKIDGLPLRNLFACDPDELVSSPLQTNTTNIQANALRRDNASRRDEL